MLNDHDVSIVIDLARGLTGNVVDRMRYGVIAQNVWARMQQLKYRDFESYLRYVASNDSEISHLVSALTIHTTSWFREPSTCEKFSEIATAFAAKGEKAAFRVLSIGCSTGEEVYSYGLILDSIKSRYPTFEYVLEGWDIDPQCLKVARSAMYSISGLSAISQSFRHLIRPMQGISFHVPSQVVERCRWRIVNLDKPPKEQITFDFISCRNLLIYFSPKQITAALEFMSGILVPK